MKLQISYETEDASGGVLECVALLLEQDGLRAIFEDDTSSQLLFSFNGAAYKRAEFNPLVADSVHWQEALELDGDEELEVFDEAGRRLIILPQEIRFACSTAGVQVTSRRGIRFSGVAGTQVTPIRGQVFMRWQDIPGTWLEGDKGQNDLGTQLIIAPRSYFLPRESKLDRSPRARPSSLAERASA